MRLNSLLLVLFFRPNPSFGEENDSMFRRSLNWGRSRFLDEEEGVDDLSKQLKKGKSDKRSKSR